MKHSTLLWAILAFTVVTSVGFARTWSDPILLTELNDQVNGAAYYPHLSRDGQTLYFGRTESGVRQIYSATRNTNGGAFSNITRISELDLDSKSLYTPWISDNDLRLYYGKYLGGATGLRLYMASRNSNSDPWSPNLIFSDIHIDETLDSYPSLTSNELMMYYISDRGRADDDTRIWMATRSSINDQFSGPVLVSELDRGNKILGPCILPDGLTIYYAEKSNNQYDIFRATRGSISDPFSNIESISLNTPFGIESSPYVTPDESEIFYVSTEGIMYSTLVPEPATLGLLALGGLLLRKRK